MAFVYEEITREEDVKYFDALEFENPIDKSPIRAVMSEKYGFKKEWLIDRERNVFIIALGGQGLKHSELPMYYVMVFCDSYEKVRFCTYDFGNGNRFDGKNLWWDVNVYDIPSVLQEKKDLIFEMIKQGLYEEENRGLILSTKFDIYEGDNVYGF